VIFCDNLRMPLLAALFHGKAGSSSPLPHAQQRAIRLTNSTNFILLPILRRLPKDYD
jgi:hypothetical protein